MARSRIGRTVTRELGMALAVLALWMMSLLVPLHQTSGLLREMARRGVDISDAWSICVTLAQDEDGHSPANATCPAQGIGKNDIGMPPPPVQLVGHVADFHDIRFPVDTARHHRPPTFQPGQPRAPPAQG